jgi:hypothetical protein
LPTLLFQQPLLFLGPSLLVVTLPQQIALALLICRASLFISLAFLI